MAIKGMVDAIRPRVRMPRPWVGGHPERGTAASGSSETRGSRCPRPGHPNESSNRELLGEICVKRGRIIRQKTKSGVAAPHPRVDERVTGFFCFQALPARCKINGVPLYSVGNLLWFFAKGALNGQEPQARFYADRAAG